MPGSSPGMTTEMKQSLHRALGGLGKLLVHAVALQLRKIVDEQHAVEMIDLVLDAGGIEALSVLLMQLAVEIQEAHTHLRRPLDLLIIFGDRKAAFLVDGLLLRRGDDLRV